MHGLATYVASCDPDLAGFWDVPRGAAAFCGASLKPCAGVSQAAAAAHGTQHPCSQANSFIKQKTQQCVEVNDKARLTATCSQRIWLEHTSRPQHSMSKLLKILQNSPLQRKRNARHVRSGRLQHLHLAKVSWTTWTPLMKGTLHWTAKCLSACCLLQCGITHEPTQ